MLIKLTEEEHCDQQSLIILDKEALSNISQVYRIRDLLILNRVLVAREQDAWLLRFSLVHGIPISKINDFQFTKQGEVLIGDDNESIAPIRNEKVGGRGVSRSVKKATTNDQRRDQVDKATD
jgi:hypothetical protein